MYLDRKTRRNGNQGGKLNDEFETPNTSRYTTNNIERSRSIDVDTSIGYSTRCEHTSILSVPVSIIYTKDKAYLHLIDITKQLGEVLQIHSNQLFHELHKDYKISTLGYLVHLESHKCVYYH